MSIDIGTCSSDHDMISFENWSDKRPDIFISFPYKEGKALFNCYDGELLLQWLNDPSHEFADWVQKAPDVPINDEGKNGEHGLKRFYKLYTNEFLLLNRFTEDLKKGKYADTFFDTKFLGIQRIGRLTSDDDISELHGQAPGQLTYEIISAVDESNDEAPTQHHSDATLRSITVDEWANRLTNLYDKEEADILGTTIDEQLESIIDQLKERGEIPPSSAINIARSKIEKMYY